MRQLISPITSALARRVHFKGKARLLHIVGVGPGYQDLIPEGVTEIACVEGIRIGVTRRRDIMVRELYINGFYQDDVLVALRNLLKPGDVFWDVGANYGFMSVYVDRIFDGEVEIIAFEPAPYPLAELRSNLERNGCRSVSVEACCLGERVGNATFYTSENNSWNATLVSAFAQEKDENIEIEVPVSTLDEMVGQVPPPDVLKIDVEGAETLVLEGGRNFLAEHRPPIVAEYNVESIVAAGSTPAQYIEAYTDLGYVPHYMPRPWFGWHRWPSLHEVHDIALLPVLCNLVMLGGE